ncbi:lytic murein transglycosylase [Sulfitobacter pseudonitzschiae]|uniref:Lytic murein transglycosylase n=1 Tax=Pseudosulfitobacter pseudonitzschiae TaxID=1402135 RepID=A0A9Q2NKL0_9RHOB|nr:lytic murein transglycosylase [Pseudosulfitobacter pseudonitzschiae]MBM2290535.1 lytic murein transglycosylase [Pseudosulfitobacter pseudonitzschiae]MBM2295453.1 lytic murein transglycosylase [Pseudosulfitobacter pseudonitzschiae]MBM2300365.1 lytic murein transglycosylase [Pseudosulfitobacter pseudonitzschiae]MBM2310150.1 lytic murein transglycosylase [Pseudosulfitobacter pseudonitzschiae]MBM2315062.1 lytic murein transglycosylase [Pseudosulfitobacter pseudonitzschiae]
MRYLSLTAAAALGVGFGGIVLAETSIRPVLRPQPAASASDTTVGETPVAETETLSNAGFQDWIKGFYPRAMAKGIRQSTLDAAFAGVTFDADVVRRDRNQSEFTKTIWDYLDTAVSDARIANGQEAMRKHGATLDRIEAKYGVDKYVVTAIWGLESAYGGFRGSNNTVQSLASLAYDTRRSAFFEEQLMAALTILENGDVAAARMNGSWAGAMGHTQFMPTSFLAHAVDFTGDGKRDIWSDDPTDALASTAAYLKHHGWQTGMPWGVEVTLPEGFDYTQANREITKLPSVWAGMGVQGVGGPVPDHGPAAVLLPAGAEGAAFLVFDNFEAIEAYNTADAYVIGVGYLADRIRGGAAIRASWPRGDRVLTFDERIELQERLTAQGFDTQKIDAKIGPLTVDAVRRYQLSKGIVPDGYASLRLLERLRGG